MECRIGELLGKTPELAAPGDGRIVIQKHAVRIATLAIAESDRNDLAGFGVIAEPSSRRVNGPPCSGARTHNPSIHLRIAESGKPAGRGCRPSELRPASGSRTLGCS